MPTVGDRVYTLGRWVMDNGHPDSGDRTEIHPPRLLATIRKRNTAVSFFGNGIGPKTRAVKVDIYVSGHGGGANQFYDGLSSTLNNNGLGGGNIQDVLSTAELLIYGSYGPANLGLIAEIGNWFKGGNDDLIKPVAGPSAFWSQGPESRPINDMDYDFDVPLPAPPLGPQTDMHPLVSVTTHPGHTTHINQVITYTNPDINGLPT